MIQPQYTERVMLHILLVLKTAEKKVWLQEGRSW